MSIEYITAVWELSPYKAEKLVVQLACADWANHDGEFWPSLTEIARKARLTKPGAIGIMAQMCEDGEFVQIEANTGRGHTNKYKFGEQYQDAVRAIRSQWQQKREVKGKAPLPFVEGERVNENIKRVNENGIKGKAELAHIRKNRHEPSIEPSGGTPLVNRLTISDALEEVFPGHATNIKTMNDLCALVLKMAASPEQVLAFPAWLSASYPMKALSPFSFRDQFPQFIKQNGAVNNGQNRTYKTAGERAAESTFKLAQQLTPASDNGADPAIPGFEWFDAVAGIGVRSVPAHLDEHTQGHPRQLTNGQF